MPCGTTKGVWSHQEHLNSKSYTLHWHPSTVLYSIQNMMETFELLHKFFVNHNEQHVFCCFRSLMANVVEADE